MSYPYICWDRYTTLGYLVQERRKCGGGAALLGAAVLCCREGILPASPFAVTRRNSGALLVILCACSVCAGMAAKSAIAPRGYQQAPINRNLKVPTPPRRAQLRSQATGRVEATADCG